jgi:hypothetical protein
MIARSACFIGQVWQHGLVSGLPRGLSNEPVISMSTGVSGKKCMVWFLSCLVTRAMSARVSGSAISMSTCVSLFGKEFMVYFPPCFIASPTSVHVSG